MKHGPLILLLLAAASLLSGCRKKDPDEQRLSWSSESPLSIPYHTRYQRLDKKNLVRNSSFETGRTFKLDSTKTSYVMDGWQQVGEHVEWVDTRKDTLFKKNEALSGFRAVKITRKRAFETDVQGEGIISEFIKVIPGNYSLSFYTRLKNIRTVKGRLGIRMYDAVDVRLLYFDKSKIAIHPEQPFPQLDQQIDNTFKSLSLANFNGITSFGWGKIIGKSAEFPFPDGDIPTNAHYVKIFLGLKGTGTMWIDSVDFSYTRKNFSIEERMLGYTDTTLQFQPVIIPSPKKMERMESLIFCTPGDLKRLPLIVVPPDADALTRQAADLLRRVLMERITASGCFGHTTTDIQITSADKIQQPDDQRLTFVLGAGSFEKYRKNNPAEEIRGHSQGYYIYSPNDLPHLVFLDGNNPVGVYYAVLSAVQLIDKNQPVFHNARVIDYPDFEKRYYTLDKIPDIEVAAQYASLAVQLELYKMNGAVCILEDSYDYARDSPLQIFRNQVNPSVFHLAALCSEYPENTDMSFSNLIYAPEMLKPDDSSLCYPFPVNINFMKDLSDITAKKVTEGNTMVPGFLLLHPVFNNQLLDYSNYAGWPGQDFGDFKCLYSGSSFFSFNTDDADFSRFLLFSKNKPVFMDNSMMASSTWGHYGGASPYYSGKIRLFNIFEPFLNTGIRDHLNQIDTSLFWVNCYAATELDVIRLSTAADFMWNAENYDPDRSLWRVLMSRYGAESARALVHYADQYGLMLEIESRLLRDEPLPRNLKNIQSDISNLESADGKVRLLLGADHPLMRDINALTESIQTKVEEISARSTAKPRWEK